jgi:hypothetical protein
MSKSGGSIRETVHLYEDVFSMLTPQGLASDSMVRGVKRNKSPRVAACLLITEPQYLGMLLPHG